MKLEMTWEKASLNTTRVATPNDQKLSDRALAAPHSEGTIRAVRCSALLGVVGSPRRWKTRDWTTGMEPERRAAGKRATSPRTAALKSQARQKTVTPAASHEAARARRAEQRSAFPS